MRKLTASQCGIFILHYIANQRDAAPPNPQYGSCGILPLSGAMLETAKEVTGVDYIEARIQLYLEQDYLVNHTDTIHPGAYGVSYRLDDYGPSRLLVRGEIVRESQGEAIIIPPATPHAVTVGDAIRYALVGWCTL